MKIIKPQEKRAMILDRLENFQHYASIHPGFQAAFNYLENSSINDFKDGKETIDGKRLYALAMDTQGKGSQGARLESHRRYIDLQYTVAGSDLIGYETKSACTADEKGYDSESDIEFYVNSPAVWLPVPAGSLAVFFPEDVHAPLGTAGVVHKVVIKVAVEWR
jgi:YhcH/YjgK/YiaL family protein